MRPALIPALLLAACEVGTTGFDDTKKEVPGEGWVDGPWAGPDASATDPTEDFSMWEGSFLRMIEPVPLQLMPLGEPHTFRAGVFARNGDPLPQDDVAITWSSDVDASFFGQGGTVVDSLQTGIHAITASAELPSGDRLESSVGGVVVQSWYAGTYAGLYSVTIGVLGAQLPVTCTGGTSLVVSPLGHTGSGEGACIVSILNIETQLRWVFEPEIDDAGVVTGNVGVDGFGLFTYNFPAEGTLDPAGIGFDVTWSGDIPLVGTVDGWFQAERVSIQSI